MNILNLEPDRLGGIFISVGSGMIAFIITWYLIPELSDLFLSANMAGKDLNKRFNNYKVLVLIKKSMF